MTVITSSLAKSIFLFGLYLEVLLDILLDLYFPDFYMKYIENVCLPDCVFKYGARASSDLNVFQLRVCVDFDVKDQNPLHQNLDPKMML